MLAVSVCFVEITQLDLSGYIHTCRSNNVIPIVVVLGALLLLALQLTVSLLIQVKDSVYADENFSVSVNRSAYEIVATYKKEETGIDLVIRLPNCYPLRHVDVECTRSLGISEVKCRKWLLSLTSFVRNEVSSCPPAQEQEGPVC